MGQSLTVGEAEGPANLAELKSEVQRRWGTLDLLDVLKEAALRVTGFSDEFATWVCQP